MEPPNRTFVLGAMIGGGALLASIAAAIILRLPEDPPPPAPIARVSVIPAAPVVVPVPITITPTPSPPPPPAAPELVPPPIRAATPYLQAHCLAVNIDDEHLTCEWDRGFPAISADGKTIVVEHVHEDGGRGNPNLTLEFIDVATAKRMHSIVVVDPDEYVEGIVIPAVQAKIARRVAKAQQRIDAGGYRTLEPLSRMDEETGTKLRVDVRGSKLRIVDVERRRAILHVDYAAEVVYPNHKLDPERECSGLSQAGEMPTWWDATTRTIVTNVTYHSGGCMCGSELRTFVRRID